MYHAVPASGHMQVLLSALTAPFQMLPCWLHSFRAQCKCCLIARLPCLLSPKPPGPHSTAVLFSSEHLLLSEIILLLIYYMPPLYVGNDPIFLTHYSPSTGNRPVAPRHSIMYWLNEDRNVYIKIRGKHREGEMNLNWGNSGCFPKGRYLRFSKRKSRLSG